jgi:predicted transcriptional regulator
MRRQFVLDERTEKLLDRLAAARAGNRSFVIREAIALYATFEDRLVELEAQPEIHRQMSESAGDIKAGRVMTQAQLEKRLRRKR